MSPEDQRRCLWRGRAEELFVKLKDRDLSEYDANTRIAIQGNTFVEWMRSYFVAGFQEGADFERTRNTPSKQLPYREDSSPGSNEGASDVES